MVILSCHNTNTTPLVEGPTIRLTAARPSHVGASGGGHAC